MTRSALARHLGVSRQTVWNWQNSGMLPAGERANSRRTLFDPAAVAAAEALIRGVNS